ncbi:unnamed protein product [Acanthoscelides obtectus]|uniref:Uncharacterized protein n=1 Tax=Acanthoscelides obtectus TaxID=200917 RepID=A0A9P0MGY7_ACAOB|nr:unnamed protein product [Acanthoscelides obtectus]CAK1669579.1 hypothetical protein AOBTE_LOCUS27087 [Acanthoscelides obtectus]
MYTTHASICFILIIGSSYAAPGASPVARANPTPTAKADPTPEAYADAKAEAKAEAKPEPIPVPVPVPGYWLAPLSFDFQYYNKLCSTSFVPAKTHEYEANMKTMVGKQRVSGRCYSRINC